MKQVTPKKIFDFKLLKRVFAFAKPYSAKFYASVILALVLALFSPVRPLLINYTLKKVNTAGIEHFKLMDFLAMITLIQIGFLIIETLTRFLFSFTTSWLGHRVVKDLRVKVFEKILHLNVQQFDKTPIGTLTTRTINDIEAVNDIFSEGFIPMISDVLSLIIIFISMLFIDWQLSLVCLLPFPMLIAATYFFKESVNQSFIAVRNAIASINAFAQEHLSGMQIIQSFTAEKREMGKFLQINQRHRDANIKANLAYSIFFPIVEITLAISMGLLVWFAARNLLYLPVSEATAFSGKIVTFTLLVNMMFRPLRVIADKFNVLQMGMVAAERVLLVLDNPDELKIDKEAKDHVIQGKISFDKVVFAYEPGRTVLKELSFSIAQGQTLAIVGHTGSGKSTIINLINRLYQHQAGEICIDGIPIDKISLKSLRSQIAVVLQDVFLFSGSIMDNVTLRDPSISKDQVVSAATLIGIHDFIASLPGGYDYDVQERGAMLSTGQRQLLSFLRALLFDPAILILDEATSSVDSNTEKLIQHAIEVLTHGRTSIVIAHRLSTIRKAHKIIVLGNGTLLEQGTHEALLSAHGYYTKMIEAQIIKDGD